MNGNLVNPFIFGLGSITQIPGQQRLIEGPHSPIIDAHHLSIQNLQVAYNLCHMKEDSCLALVWISLPRLPLQCFIPEFLESVGNKLGRFLCFDKATTTLARPSAARICVELDLRKPPPQFIWVGLFDGFKQPILYERMPKFCNWCHILGHTSVECSKKASVSSSTSAEDNAILIPGRTPPVRPNASGIPPPILPEHNTMSDARPQFPPMPMPNPPPASKSLPTNHFPPHPTTESNLSVTDPSQQIVPPPHNLSNKPLNPQGEDPAVEDSSHPITPHKNHPSSRHLKGKQKCKSVTFALQSDQQQSNLSANKEFWDAVNRQVAIIEQARLKAPLQSPSTNPSISPHSSTKDPSPSTNVVTSPTTQSSDESSGSSIAADSPPSSPLNSIQEAQNPHSPLELNTYDSEGEDHAAEPYPLQEHNTDALIQQMPQSSKRNKRLPDQPLKVQLRVRKDPNTIS